MPEKNELNTNKQNNAVEAEPIKKEPKKPVSKKKLFTFIGGGVGIILLIVFAIFALQPAHKVVFSSEGGNKIPTVMIDKKTGQIAEPEDPTRFGWDFVGWYDNNEFTGKAIDFSTYRFAEYTIGSATGERIYIYKNEICDKPGDELETSESKVKHVDTNKDSICDNCGEELIYKLKTTTLYARWSLHEYVISFYDYDNKTEQIIKKDSEDNEIIFSYHIRHNPTNEEIKAYTAANDGMSEKEAISILNNTLLANSKSISEIVGTSFNKEGKETVFYNEIGNVITTVDTEQPSDIKIYVQYK